MDNRICGVHAVYEALASRRQPIERIHIARETHSGKVKELLDLARERGVPVRKEERSILDRMAQGEVHQGVVAISGEVSYADFEVRSEEHTSELQSRPHLVCRLLLEKKKQDNHS